MRIENILRPTVIALTTTVAIVCGSWHDLATGGTTTVNALSVPPRTTSSAVSDAQQTTPTARWNEETELDTPTAKALADSGAAEPEHAAKTLAPSQPPMIQITKIERLGLESKLEVGGLNPIKLDPSTLVLNLPPAQSESIAPPRAPRIGMFARVKPTLVADGHIKLPAITGGFGDPLNTMQHASHSAVALAVGSFGPVSGPNSDTGAAPKGVVSGTSFGTTVSYAVPPGDSRRVVSSAVFANTMFGGTQLAKVSEEPAYKPAVVVFEQQAHYTSEAQQARIQGVVTLKVRLLASGQVDVIGIVNGLGYGLDEEARHVAESIRFNPALQNGQPVDHTTLIHVTFQLV